MNPTSPEALKTRPSRRRPHLPADRRAFVRFFNPDRDAVDIPAKPIDRLDPGPIAAPARSRWKLSNSSFELHFHVWSPEAWLRLDRKPEDVQVCEDGTRVALRIA